MTLCGCRLRAAAWTSRRRCLHSVSERPIDCVWSLLRVRPGQRRSTVRMRAAGSGQYEGQCRWGASSSSPGLGFGLSGVELRCRVQSPVRRAAFELYNCMHPRICTVFRGGGDSVSLPSGT